MNHIRPNYNRERDCRETNRPEIKALLGTLYLLGVTKSSHENVFDA